ncbi:nitric oxide reductase transcriptional regulator NorR [Alkalimonas amylolytica]|uniref:Anaerobic nitric oxide reductase transcription regulator n=1 Tax=Alkalimonas amylolytica TaxID=152573 RepID=A0A1H3ZPE3_ALKAM|nr:nitric oxide reductase transcriptional regulator NorR [Alkalimonas amylolytica]SEA25114.1 anaerobic nitric oxide reductase transcription regulator [Alkalimonas amylolytica]
MTVLPTILLADLVTELPAPVRLQRLVSNLMAEFGCGAVVLLQKQQDYLKPVAMQGLAREALGRHFAIAHHPRLAAIMARREPVRFAPDSSLPDPYDGLLDTRPEQPLAVHDCMGMSLYVEGECWGAITLDALEAGTFDQASEARLQHYSFLIESIVRVCRLERDNRVLRQSRNHSEAVVAAGKADGAIIGQSKVMQQVLRQLDVVADSDLPVLLLGETGTGKELFAQRLHQLSPRCSKPMVYINCAALPETLAESELFGHVKGAFSGAGHDRAGRFEAADGGTLFLDEVGELPLSIQAKLLRVLQNGEVQRLGTDKPRTVNVRIVAATNRQLAKRVQDGEFRADLYHRLSVYPLPIPPLRERELDILLLAGHFLEQNRVRLGFRSLRFAAEAEQLLLQYDWPGNVRELEHVLSRAAIQALSHGQNRQDIVTLEAHWLGLAASESNLSQNRAEQSLPLAGLSLKQAVQCTQRQMISSALQQHQQCWADAARALGVDASNLHKLAQKLGLKAGKEPA